MIETPIQYVDSPLLLPTRANFLTDEEWECAMSRQPGDWTWATREGKRIGVLGAAPDGLHYLWERAHGFAFHGSEEALDIVASAWRKLPWTIERGFWKRAG